MKKTLISVALTAMWAMVAVVGVFSAQGFAQEQTPALCKAAVYRGPGASDTCANSTLEILNNTEGYEARFISAEEIQKGGLKDYDVVCFPGGTGSGERRALGDKGWKELWSYLKNGGGYVGTCAGAYLALATNQRPEGNLINAELQEGAWERGEAILEIELTDEGRAILGDLQGRLNVAYQNGPVFHPANRKDLEPYTVLAYFRTEIAENNAPKGVQIDSPAIATAPYGKGRVVILSPHPELTPNLNMIVPKIVRYAANK